MSVLAIEEFRALIPVPVVLDVRAFLKIVHVKLGRAAEVLLAVSVVALGPFVLLVDEGAEARLV